MSADTNSGGALSWREAARVVLHEQYTVLTGREVDEGSGIFADYEMETWHIEGDTIGRVFDTLGYTAPKGLLADGIRIERIPAHTGRHIYEVPKDIASIRRIDARIPAPHLLELRVTYENWVQEVTYSGTFTVEWMDIDVPPEPTASPLAETTPPAQPAK